jgi:hypothetical protein
VLGPAAVSINPGSGAVSSNVTVSGGGFAANEQVRLWWDNSSSAWATVQANASGSFLWPATVPSLSRTNHTLNAKGQSSNKTTSTSFTVTASGGNSGTSMIGPGTYRVTATIEGLVGHTTSAGHLITPFDHFVALPACTETSCPWLRPGGSTYVAPCGDNCYVRVLNPATNQCSVAPVLDRGPWFINDNWWETPDKRYLNNRSGAVNHLAQGYTGADAARNGLDVGFGLSNGIGVSDVGYQVGNRAAIDIADGTWVDIGIPQSAGITTVVVTMLWQTGENHAAAALACGQGTEELKPSLKLSPTGGPSGSAVQVTGTGYRSNEQIKIHWATSRTAAIRTVTANSSGGFTTTINVPSNAADGSYRIYGIGQASKARAGVTFTVRPPTTGKPAFSLSPKSGPPGATVTVTGSGYLANESVTVHLDSGRNAALKTVTANSSGQISADFVLPDAPGGDHRVYVKGKTSGIQTGQTFKVSPSVAPGDLTGGARQTVNYQVKGFGPNETVSLYWGSGSTAEASATTDAKGNATIRAKAPWTGTGVTGTFKGGTSRLSTTTKFTVVAAIRLEPKAGDEAGQISVRGTGFKPSSTVNIYWGSSSSSNLICSIRASSGGGAFTCKTSPKPGAAPGAHTILAIGGGASASASFTLSASQASQASIAEATPTATPTTAPAESPPEATATPEPTLAPIETPTPEPTIAPEPTPRELVFYPVADVSISAASPDAPQPLEQAAALAAGGADGEVALITFEVSGVAPGTAVQATLVLTGAGDAGAPGGRVSVAGGYWVDEAFATYNTAPVNGLAAVGSIAWVDPGVEIAVDVTGVVAADGTITFVISGVPDGRVVFTSRESGAPPRLVVIVLDPPSA